MGHQTHHRSCAWLAAAGLAGLAGCSTSPVALEQANHTVGLMSQLEVQLVEFRRVQAAAEKARLESLSRQKGTLVRVNESVVLNAQASKSAGDMAREPFARKLLADADGLAEAKARALTEETSYSAKLNALLTPLPSTASSIAQAQTKAALLGRELDNKIRFEELQAFLTELAQNVRDNRKKIADAEAAAAKAAASAASAPKP